MSGAKPVHWALLADDVLRKLGSTDSLNAASRRISEEMRAWGVPDSDGLVICHQSVLHRESDDGIVWLERMPAVHKRVAFGEEPGASTADRLCAALALLTSAHVSEAVIEAEDAKRAQAVLTDILLEHPVLLHPRLTAPVFRPMRGIVELMPVMGVILAAKGAPLPSAPIGVDEATLKRFANSNLVMAPFQRLSPKRAWAASPTVGLQKKEVAGGKPLQSSTTVFGTPMPPLVASILELSRLRGFDKDIITPNGEGDGEVFKMLRASIAHAMGIHHFSINGGFAKWERCDAYMREVSAGGYMRLQKVRGGLAEELLERILMCSFELDKDRTIAPPDLVAENCELVLSGLVDLGLAETRLNAARWLASYSLSESRFSISLPRTEIGSVLAFFDTMRSAGLEVQELCPKVLGEKPRELDCWIEAFELFSRQEAMKSVLASPKVTSQDGQPVTPSPQRRLRAI